jgi:hypothetical protein
LAVEEGKDLDKLASGRRGFFGGLIFVFFLISSAVGVTRGAFVLLDPVAARPGQIPIGVMDKLLVNMGALERVRGRSDLTRVAVLGDSTVDAYPKGEKVPDRLRRALNRSPRRNMSVLVANLAYPALGPASYYLLADRIAAVQPDLIVWEVSLTHASERWRRSLSRPELAGWMSLARFPEIFAMPIDDIGLTADKFFLYQLIVKSGNAEAWRDFLIELSRMDKLREIFEQWLQPERYPPPESRFRFVSALTFLNSKRQEGSPDRYNREGEINHFGSVLEGIGSDHPTIRYIAATIRYFSERGILVLAYLNPVNIEHLKSVGVIDNLAFERTLEAYRLAVLDNGGLYLDLHDRFPDSHFGDMNGHFRHDGEVKAQIELAEILADYIDRKRLLDEKRGK